MAVPDLSSSSEDHRPGPAPVAAPTNSQPADGLADNNPTLWLDVARRIALLGGRRVELGGRAFDLLAMLAGQPGRWFTPQELVARVWQGRVVEPGNLRVQINQLRRGLGNAAIENRPGQGYRFVGPVRQLEHAGSGAPLIGRGREQQALADATRRARLVTLVGAGGIGKTRLARAWFDALTAAPDRVRHWLDLATLDRSVPLLPVLAATLVGAPAGASGTDAGGRSQPRDVAELARRLPPGELRLVLDNAEHLTELLAPLLQALLAEAPGLRLLVTSQVPLRLPDEQVLRLGPLDMPEGTVPLATARELGAVALFVDRVQAVDAGFELGAGNLAEVCELCRRLDGLPLAIELAAARVPALGLGVLARSLDLRLQVLGNPSSSAPLRQRTLSAALDWSHGLLEPGAQAVFARLAVFAGPFTLDDALGVVADADAVAPRRGPEDDAAPDARIDRLAVLDALTTLVDCSLLVTGDGDPPRYRLLESPRLFAQQRLEARGEADVLRSRHLAWCAGWLDQARPDQVLAGQGQLLAALEWALAGGDAAGGAALAQRLADHPVLSQRHRRDAGPADARQASATAAFGPAAQATDEALATLIARLKADGVIRDAERAGLAYDTLLSLARRLKPDEVRNFDAAVRELEHAVQLAGQAMAGPDDEAAVPSVHAQLVEQTLAEVARHTRAGQFDQGTDQVDEALAELDRREARRIEGLKASRRRLLEAGLQQDQLRRDAFAVARRLEALVAIDQPQQPTESAAWAAHEDRHADDGRQHGAVLATRVAAEMMRRRLAACPHDSARRQASIRLAQLLNHQGQFDSDNAGLLEAEQVCREALAITPRQTDATAWATLQHELADALCALAQRSGEAARLTEAVACCDAALAVRRRADAPQDWALTQLVKGKALRTLGMSDASGGTLPAAEQSLRDALRELTPARAPLPRAEALNQLSVVLILRGSRSRSAALWREGIDTQHAALALLDRARHPLAWAISTTNLGIGLQMLGADERDPQLLEQAVQAFQAALGALDRQTVPARWARTQHNLASTLARLGEVQRQPTPLRQAIDAYGQVLRVHTHHEQPLAWAAGKNELATALQRWGSLVGGADGAAAIHEGIEHLRDALVVRSRDAHPVDWAKTMSDLGVLHFRLAQLTGEMAAALESRRLLLQLREVLHRDAHAEFWKQAELTLDEVDGWLARRDTSVVTVA